MPRDVRRVVTGHDETGRSVVLYDGPAKSYPLGRGGSLLFDIWRTLQSPAPIAPAEPDPTAVPLDFNIDHNGVRIRLLDMAPPEEGAAAPYMHRTESIDYGYVIEGEMCMLLDDSEIVLQAGDVIVQRGTNHAWVNRSGRRCRMLFVMIGGDFAPELRDVGDTFSPEALQAVMTDKSDP